MNRGRDAHYGAPPAQIRTCGIPVYGSLDDRLVDVASDAFDVAIRIGGLDDTSATMLRLADNRRVLAAASTYQRRRRA
jgi:DNA-binding transcriptional LysR family regulator